MLWVSHHRASLALEFSLREASLRFSRLLGVLRPGPSGQIEQDTFCFFVKRPQWS